MDSDSGGQAGAHQSGEIKITEAMIDVGLRALSPFPDFLETTRPELLRRAIADVYRSMSLKALALQDRS
jgi:hypothetical protein